MSNSDIFINNKIYKNAADIFATSVSSLSSIKSKCIFVLDTNALLLPYTTSSKSIDEFKKVYSKLIEEKRLFIPGQVAREFAKNRPERIKELFQQLNRKRDKVKKLSEGQYPLLAGIKEYDEIILQEKKIDELLKEYQKKIGSVMERIKEWTWNDPVSQVYNSLFTEDVIVDPQFDEQQTNQELQNRYNHKIPPGYKDSGKSDDGIGDLLIWFTILELGKTKQKDIVFVSGDEKTDWFHKSEKQALYPRFELITEFREKTEKKSFNIIKLSEMLELWGADDKVVKEVEVQESTAIANSSADGIGNIYFQQNSIYTWISHTYGNEWKIDINERGFPDAVVTKSDNTKVCVEIASFSTQEGISMRFNEMFGRAYHHADEKAFDEFIFFLICPQEIIMDIIINQMKRIREIYNSRKMPFEIIVGFINDKNRFEEIASF